MRMSTSLAFLVLALTTNGHPGHDHSAEAAVRRDYFQHARSDLSHCTEHLKARGHVNAQIARRQELLRSLRLSQGLEARDPSDLNKSHESHEDYSLHTPPQAIFDSYNSCILSPEVIEGPYCTPSPNTSRRDQH